MAVGRFQVMATLQAARAFVLGMPLGSAKSFGLNRAIFYAAAKRGFKGAPKKAPSKYVMAKQAISGAKLKNIQKSFKISTIGDEIAYRVNIEGKQLFLIGNQIQSPEDFKRQIELKFEGKFKQAWQEAVKTCKEFDKSVLLSQRYFYETVYKPRRDELAEKWNK